MRLRPTHHQASKRRSYERTEKSRDLLPEEFASYEEAAEFWGSHDTSDYPDAFADEPVKLDADFKRSGD